MNTKRQTNNSRNAALEEKNDENQVPTISMIKTLFEEMFAEQKTELAETFRSATEVTNKKIDKLTADILRNNEKLVELTRDVNDVKESIEASEAMLEEKMKKLEEKVKNEQQKGLDMDKYLANENKELREKLRNLEDRSRRDNLRLNGVEEYDNEFWADTKETLKEFIEQNLGLRNIKIERAHRTGEKNGSNDAPRTIVAKFSSFKIKEVILKNASKLKGTHYYINEEFSKETLTKIGKR